MNLEAVLKAANSSLNRVVKTTVFLKDMNDFAAMNTVYAQVSLFIVISKIFGEHKPARAAVEAARLPKDVRVEIECVALV